MINKRDKILVCGSIVIDVISGEKFYGGTGGNIAYGLGQLGVSPILFSLVGKDFNIDYGKHLKNLGVDLNVSVDKMKDTANFSYSILDQGIANGVWSPNVYKNIDKLSLIKTISDKKLKDVTIAIFSPGSPESTYKHLKEFKSKNQKALTIFDPGQMISFYSKKQFVDCATLADLTILNDYEYKEISKTLKKDLVSYFKNLNKIIIKTKGDKGSEIFINNKIIKVKAVIPKKVYDTMGAGDAYRSGMLYKLIKGKTLKEACEFGAITASINVSHIGCQSYKIPKKLIK